MRRQALSVSASLDTLRRFLRPSDSVISPLKSRDVLPNGKQLMSLNLSYELNYTESIKLTPRFPRFEL
jgi:tripeptidyl-peptidase-2